MNISETLKAVDKEREYVYRKNEVDCKHARGFAKLLLQIRTVVQIFTH